MHNTHVDPIDACHRSDGAPNRSQCPSQRPCDASNHLIEQGRIADERVAAERECRMGRRSAIPPSKHEGCVRRFESMRVPFGSVHT